MGNIACCKDENCGRGRVLYATGPPMIDYIYIVFFLFNLRVIFLIFFFFWGGGDFKYNVQNFSFFFLFFGEKEKTKEKERKGLGGGKEDDSRGLPGKPKSQEECHSYHTYISVLLVDWTR